MMIPGPAGAIEAILEQAAAERSSSVAVLCHPHPLYGGSMHDGVLSAAADPLRRGSIDTLRFNFRGVGHSEGVHDDGDGEVEDLAAVVQYARTNLGYGEVMIAGYSFGSRVAWRGARRCEATGLVLIAPPMPAMAFDPDLAPTCPVLAIAGDRDNFADTETLQRWCLEPGAEAQVIKGADHFFGPHIGALADAVESWRKRA